MRRLHLTLLCLIWVITLDAWGQADRGRPSRPVPRSDVFSTNSRDNACDTNNWIHAHGGRWNRCEWERDCPGADTRFYGPPDRFPATARDRMLGYARCAVDPCTPGGAQCWGKIPPDNFNTQSQPNARIEPQTPIRPPVRVPGGYDPCANPRPAPGCPNTEGPWLDRPVSPLAGQAGNGPGDCIETHPGNTQSQQSVQQAGNEALRTFAAMGGQGNQLLKDLTEILLEQIANLAQPNWQVWHQRTEGAKQIGRAVVDYMTNDTASNHNRLRVAAEQAAEAFRRHPTRALAEATAAVLTGRAGTMVQGGCTATVNQLKHVVGERLKAEKAARRLKQILENEKKQISGPGNLCNPGGLQNACVPSSWADELNDEIGKPVFTADNFRFDRQDVPTPWPRMHEVQKKMWGDRRFSAHDPTRAMLQSLGMPYTMPKGLPGVIDELRNAGPGAGGFITIVRADGTAHLIRGRNIGGQVGFRDSAVGIPGSINFEPGFHPSPIVRIDLYRTTGPDMLPRQ